MDSPIKTRTFVLHPARKQQGEGTHRSADAKLAEACGLAKAIALEVVHTAIVPLSKPVPATLIGSGNVARLGSEINEMEITLAVVDAHLTPIQQRNLEKAWGCKVIDRTGLILEIFGARARTREGTLQVELAALDYQRSRLVRSWTHLERQRGGFGFLGGPGETQIEADRRLIGDRIVKLKRELEEVKRTRDLHRKARKRVPYPIVALVGYTNAGKSTLFNHLTKSTVMAEDLLFATLDPTLRGLVLPSGTKIILSDTVGFISDLPHELVVAFRATLEEVLEADLVVHVRDISHPDAEAQAEDVIGVLKGLGVSDQALESMIEVRNKIDLISEDLYREVTGQAKRTGKVCPVSALTGVGIDGFLATVQAQLQRNRAEIDVDIPLEDGAAIAWLYRHGEVVDRQDSDGAAHIRVRLDAADAERYRRRMGEA